MNRKTKVILYTKPGCHLCEEAKAQIHAANCADLYELQEVNIETDPALMKLYGLKIPVITINGTEAFKYRVSPTEFRQVIKTTHR
jgi:glutaredoxin